MSLARGVSQICYATEGRGRKWSLQTIGKQRGVCEERQIECNITVEPFLKSKLVKTSTFGMPVSS